MFDAFFKNMSQESKGVLASILGLILILGTLGKLHVLESILNSIMIMVGLFLLIWGVNASNSFCKIKDYVAHMTKKKK